MVGKIIGGRKSYSIEGPRAPDGAGPGLYTRAMRALLLALALAAASPAARAQPVRSIELPGRVYQVNGAPAQLLGFGTYKDVLVHPQDSGLVVKVFRNNLADGLTEKRAEVSALKTLVPIGAAPKLVDHGAVALNGAPTGFLVQERVRGLTLERPTPTKLAETKLLFQKLAKARVELVDVASLVKLRENIMVGETDSGGFQAWLVDPDIKKSERTAAELSKFYDGLLVRLAAR